MAMRRIYSEIKGKKVTELPCYFKSTFSMETVKTSVRRGLDNYNDKYIQTSSVDPLLNNGGEKGGNKIEKTETSVSRYEETYKKLDKLDFVTAAKILFTEPPKKNKFGFDWHVVQFIIVCLPSLAVYLVAQYGRHKMKIMDAELGLKLKKEEEKKEKEEAEQKALEEEASTKSKEEVMEMKKRLTKIEETVKEIVLEAKKPSGNVPTKTQEAHSTKDPKSKKEQKSNVQNQADLPPRDD